MKLITAGTCAFLTFALLGCSQHASTEPTAARPGNLPSSDVNTFGDSKDAATGTAAAARAQHYSSEKDADREANSTDSGTTPAPR